MTDLPADDMTELRDAHIDRVDLVGKAANGTSFLMRKAAADGLLQPLVPAEMVADLIKRADQETPVTQPAEPLAKADLDVADAPEPDQLVPDAPGGSTANSLPGSADWEQLDGDTAMNAVATLGRVKACLGWLASREAQESVSGSGDDDAMSNAWDLDDAACQLDWIIGRLAAFAVGEHMEADGLEAVGKAVAEMAGPLAVVERLAPIAKAGRMLSGANETTIRGVADSLDEASSSLRTILAALPQAPAADDVTKTEETDVAKAKTLVIDVQPRLVTADGEPVEKGTDMAAELLKGAKTLTAVDVFRALLAGGQKVDVTKAKGDPQMAVFSADGKLVGVIDPADLNPIAATEAPSEGDTEGSGDDAPADDQPAADDAAAAPAADADSRVVPGTDTVQAPAPAAPADDQTPAVAKQAADPATLEEIRKQVTEDVRKGVEAELAELREQVRKFGLTPDHRNSPTLNGGNGVPGVVTRDGSQVDEFADLRKAVADAQTPSERKAAQAALNFAELRERITHR